MLAGQALTMHSPEVAKLKLFPAARYLPERGTDLPIRGNHNPDLGHLTPEALKDPRVGGNPVEMTVENTRALFVKTGIAPAMFAAQEH